MSMGHFPAGREIKHAGNAPLADHAFYAPSIASPSHRQPQADERKSLAAAI